MKNNKPDAIDLLRPYYEMNLPELIRAYKDLVDIEDLEWGEKFHQVIPVLSHMGLKELRQKLLYKIHRDLEPIYKESVEDAWSRLEKE